jgi:hypothetical protein
MSTSPAQTKKAGDYIRTFPAQPEQATELALWVRDIYEYVENEARDAVDWYTRHAKTKRWGSLLFRYLAIVLGGLAGLLPIVFAVAPPPVPAAQASLLVSLLIGLVALLIAVDRFGDFSAGWMRYMLTALNIRKELQEFRMDWARQYAELPDPLQLKNVPAVVDRAKQFVLKVEGYIGDETRQWATEFQQNLKQMETEITKKMEEREKQTEAAVKTGALQLTLTNAKDADNRTFTVHLEPGKLDEKVNASQVWVKTGLAPGIYTVTARGEIGGRPAADSKAVTVGSNQVATVELTLFAP